MSKPNVPVKYRYTFHGKRWSTDDTCRLWSLSVDRPLSTEEIQEECAEVIRKMYLQVTCVDVEITHTHVISGIKPVYNDGHRPIRAVPDGEQMYYMGTAPDYGEFWYRADDRTYICFDGETTQTWHLSDDGPLCPDWVIFAKNRHRRGEMVKINRDMI